MDQAVLEIRNLTVDLPSWADRPQAVSNVSLSLKQGEILCVVGESGSGKSVMSRAVMGLLPAPHVRPSAGRIFLQGEDLLESSPARMRGIRSKSISMIFQEPMTALNPVMTIGKQIEEVLKVHTPATKAERLRQMTDMLAAVGLPEPAKLLRSFPHQLSGGQRQRAMIAMALILEPLVLIADEPTTALDVTTQAQILALIKETEAKGPLGVLFVTHDFGVVAEIADRVAVMQHGKLVEFGEAEAGLERSSTSLHAGPNCCRAAPCSESKEVDRRKRTGNPVHNQSGQAVSQWRRPVRQGQQGRACRKGRESSTSGVARRSAL